MLKQLEEQFSPLGFCDFLELPGSVTVTAEFLEKWFKKATYFGPDSAWVIRKEN